MLKTDYDCNFRSIFSSLNVSYAEDIGKSEGVITKYNPVTGELITKMPGIHGQSGSGVFLKEEDRFLGIIHSGSRNLDGKDIANVIPMNERLTKRFNKNK
ncbi:TPA: hypothetical protein ACF8UL_002749 [Staphylococcus aureus]|uniref:Putative serine protease-like protein n=1 Tax=Staphylococcus aureus TaxID=1280 RepID=A0A1W5T8W2_STAAU|nr:hypothetical protein [Staphylococcus aureus]ARF19433.1 putative serine protease-like protein [Staphylococcus aureus]MBL0430708.1 hypothetical protein [Staphylococcus aureus]HDH0858026.1 hypothetical protein [Staphylococcus aureus]HDH5694720.1 hypothetical protein [Staphylococcus aureus]HDH5697451.1 hypothetical protein [Staphylococcus aureus]